MTRYTIGITCVLDNGKNRVIPMDEGNRHYKEYLEWVSKGNEPDPMTDDQKLMYD
jgi:hypothetical protein